MLKFKGPAGFKKPCTTSNKYKRKKRKKKNEIGFRSCWALEKWPEVKLWCERRKRTNSYNHISRRGILPWLGTKLKFINVPMLHHNIQIFVYLFFAMAFVQSPQPFVLGSLPLSLSFCVGFSQESNSLISNIHRKAQNELTENRKTSKANAHISFGCGSMKMYNQQMKHWDCGEKESSIR